MSSYRTYTPLPSPHRKWRFTECYKSSSTDFFGWAATLVWHDRRDMYWYVFIFSSTWAEDLQCSSHETEGHCLWPLKYISVLIEFSLSSDYFNFKGKNRCNGHTEKFLFFPQIICFGALSDCQIRSFIITQSCHFDWSHLSLKKMSFGSSVLQKTVASHAHISNFELFCNVDAPLKKNNQKKTSKLVIKTKNFWQRIYFKASFSPNLNQELNFKSTNMPNLFF